MKKLVLFIHGLGGTADGTWQKFPELIRGDAELAKRYDVRTFKYRSGFLGPKPSLAKCAVSLKTEIESRYLSSDYSDIALIAHSQGGLVARRYIADWLISGQPLRVSRLLTFATPHQGSGYASLLKQMPFTSQQVEELDPNSGFLQALGVAWGQSKADRRVLTRYVVAADDAIVGQVSAMGSWSPDYEVVNGVGHRAIVKPGLADDTSFLIAKRFLLEDGLQPGGVEADYHAPLLRLNYVDSVESARFTYSARVLPFIGRDAESKVLVDFLGGLEQPFRWMVMHGSGGVGKSRIALELCLHARSEWWHAGFLPEGGLEPDWGRWWPLLPTLIVIDYVARDPKRTGRLLQALAGRGAADGTLRLAAPVRVLIIARTIERKEGAKSEIVGDVGRRAQTSNESVGAVDRRAQTNVDWLDEIVGYGTTKKQVDAAHASANLELATISDPWPVFEFILNRAKKPLPDKRKILGALSEIDRERRPLFAYFMADAIAAGRDVRDFDAERLLDDVIDRDRKAFWKPAGATAKEERLLALATMTGGLPVSALENVTEKLLPSWDVDRHPATFLAMTGRESGDEIAPLEPDIVGEHFTLACLAESKLSDEDRARFCGLAWRLNPHGTAQFMLLAHRDLPAHPMLSWVRKSPPPESFLLDGMRGAAARDEATLWNEWAKAGANLIYDLGSGDAVAARALVDDMRGVAVARDEATLWNEWARAAANLASARASRHTVGVDKEERALLDDIRSVAAARDEATLWKEWARGGANIMPYSDIMLAVAARALLDDIRSVGAARDEAALWEMWARATANLISTTALQIFDKDAGRALLADLRGVAAARDEATLWNEWARAAANSILGLTSGDRVGDRALLDDIRSVAAARDEAPLWNLWAWAASRLTYTLGSGGRVGDVVERALLDDMRSVAAARDEATLWTEWARGGGNLIISLVYGSGSGDRVVERALLDDIRSVAAARDEAKLWEMWAMTAVHLMIALRAGDGVAARALLDDIRSVAAARDEATLWTEWAKAALNLIIVLRSGDRVAAEALFAEVLSLPPEILRPIGHGWLTAQNESPSSLLSKLWLGPGQ
jgi:Palmitoyl protein thioesterase